MILNIWYGQFECVGCLHVLYNVDYFQLVFWLLTTGIPKLEHEILDHFWCAHSFAWPFL